MLIITRRSMSLIKLKVKIDMHIKSLIMKFSFIQFIYFIALENHYFVLFKINIIIRFMQPTPRWLFLVLWVHIWHPI